MLTLFRLFRKIHRLTRLEIDLKFPDVAKPVSCVVVSSCVYFSQNIDNSDLYQSFNLTFDQ